jgi:hypothetical protein
MASEYVTSKAMLNLSWPAGHICPTGHEKFEVSSWTQLGIVLLCLYLPPLDSWLAQNHITQFVTRFQVGARNKIEASATLAPVNEAVIPINPYPANVENRMSS